VLIAPQASFQIASERLDCPSETDPASFGSDEVAIRIVTVPVGLDLTPGATMGALGSAVAVALGLGASWAAAIAAAVALAFNFFVALWAPADLIIQDADGFTTLDLANLTSAVTPAPGVREYASDGGIKVKVEPVTKDVQYREQRQYISDAEDSRYLITLRYNRF